MDRSNEAKDARKWPISLPRLDTASKSDPSPSRKQQEDPVQKTSDRQQEHVDRRQYRQSLRDKTHIHRHSHRRTRTRDAIQSPFDHNPLKAAFGSSKADISQSSLQQLGTERIEETEIRERPPVTQADIDRERQSREPREQEVASALSELLCQAQDATKRMDDTFYGLLSRTTDLSQHITSLRKLQESSGMFLKHLDHQTTHCSAELNATLEKFNDFGEQRNTIEALHTRLRNGKARSADLEIRLDTVGWRLASFEQRESETQKSRSARWKMTAGGLAICLVLVVTLLSWSWLRDSRLFVFAPASDYTRGLIRQPEHNDKQFADRLRVLDEL